MLPNRMTQRACPWPPATLPGFLHVLLFCEPTPWSSARSHRPRTRRQWTPLDEPTPGGSRIEDERALTSPLGRAAFDGRSSAAYFPSSVLPSVVRSFAPSPRQLEPCMQASVVGSSRASFSISVRWFLELA